MKRSRKGILIVAATLGIILLTEILVRHFFPNLTFVNGNLTIANKILGYFAFSGFLLSISALFRATKILVIPLGLILFLIFFIDSCSEIYPIDTTTQPQDISVMQTNKDGSKWIVRERIKVKTNGTIRDTVLVKDNFIFRRIIEPKE